MLNVNSDFASRIARSAVRRSPPTLLPPLESHCSMPNRTLGLLGLVAALVAIDVAAVCYVSNPHQIDFVLGRTLLSGLLAGQLSIAAVAIVTAARVEPVRVAMCIVAFAATVAALTSWIGCSPSAAFSIAAIHLLLTFSLGRRAFVTSSHFHGALERGRRDQFSTKDLLVWTTFVALIAASGHLLHFAAQLPPGIVMMALVPGLFAGSIVYLTARLPTATDRIAAVLLMTVVLANILDSRVAGLQFPAAFLWTATQAVQLLLAMAVLIPAAGAWSAGADDQRERLALGDTLPESGDVRARDYEGPIGNLSVGPPT